MQLGSPAVLGEPYICFKHFTNSVATNAYASCLLFVNNLGPVLPRGNDREDRAGGPDPDS
jgi:hypothetical protein